MKVYELPEGTLMAQEYAFFYVRYPSRKTPDLYMSLKQRPVQCCQCEGAIPKTGRGVSAQNRLERLIDHIRSHDPRAHIRREPSCVTPRRGRE